MLFRSDKKTYIKLGKSWNKLWKKRIVFEKNLQNRGNFQRLRSALNAGHLAGHHCQRTMYAGKMQDTPPAYLGICRRKGVRWAQRVQHRRPIIMAAGVNTKAGHRDLYAAGVEPA